MSSIVVSIDERLADLPERERSVQEREGQLLETYATLEEQRALLLDGVKEVQHQLGTLGLDSSELEDELSALGSVGTELEETYRPLIELRESIVLQRTERCDAVAGRVKEASDELLEAREGLERLRDRVRELETKAEESSDRAPVEESSAPDDAEARSNSAPTLLIVPEPEVKPFEARAAEAANDEVVAVETRISPDSEDNFYCGLDGDEVGVFASTIELLPLGQRVNVRVQLNGSQTVSCHGRVKWFRDWDDDQPNLYPGMGIELVDLDPDGRTAIDDFMSQREPWLFV